MLVSENGVPSMGLERYGCLCLLASGLEGC